jgi:predicted RND superfamily exporter protein
MPILEAAIVLPLILGIGVDNGVHFVHDFTDQRHGYRLSNSTAWAVLWCATTTVTGFGSMTISGQRGL